MAPVCRMPPTMPLHATSPVVARSWTPICVRPAPVVASSCCPICVSPDALAPLRSSPVIDAMV
eukprot:5619228-Prymnesium_polylepis.1